MSFRNPTIALGLLTAFAVSGPLSAASPTAISGQILGEVKSGMGVAQMGASVLLYNRYEQLIRHAITNESGKFGFDGLAPDVYSIRVSLASFVPALRRNIEVLAGGERVLNINLASVLSTIQMAPIGAPSATIMSDEWKWVLRASQATRPALRVLPNAPPAPPATRTAASRFSETTGMVRVSAGGSDPMAGDMQQDLGTAFGVATSINGGQQVRVSGNLGYAPASGLPSASFRATYARAADVTRGAQLALTARQVYLPVMSGSGTPGSPIGPVLRTAAMTAVDRVDVAENIHVEYGVSLESISYQDRLTYLSTFGRATYDMPSAGTVKFGYSSATDPRDLMARQGDASESINGDLATLSKLPRISRRDGRTRVQRSQNFEAGYSIVDGSRTYSASAFSEDISNSRFLMSGSREVFSDGDLLPDLNTRGVVFNAGNFRRTGISVAATQALGDRAEVSIAAGRSSALAAHEVSSSASAEDIRSSIHAVPRPWVTVRASSSIPVVGTNVTTSYGWTDFRTLVPLHYSLTSSMNQEIGWNVRVRQPLPGFGGMRMEAVADLRNLLAQGYLPIGAGDRRSVLTSSPRAVRGGLSFIF